MSQEDAAIPLDLRTVSDALTVFQVQTPREAYSQLRTNREKASFLVMMKMDPATLALVRKEFSKRGDGVGIEEFCNIMIAYILNGRSNSAENEFMPDPNVSAEERKTEFVANMIELFTEVDVNGDGDMEWEEFTKFVVEKASIFRQRFTEDATAEYFDTSYLLDLQCKAQRRHDIASMCILPKSTELAMIEEHTSAVSIHSARTGKQTLRVRMKGVPHAIQYIEQSDIVVAACADMSLNVITLDDPMPSRRYTVTSTWPTPYTQMSLAWMAVHNLLYSGSANGDIYGWNIENRSNVCSLRAHDDVVMKVLTLRSLDNLVSASLDTKIGIWDSFTASLVLKLEGHSRGVFGLSFNSHHRLLASSGFDHDVYMWSPFVNKLVYKLRGHHSSIVDCCCVDETHEVITADSSGIFKIWDIRTFQCMQTFGGVGLAPQYGYSNHNAESGTKASLSCFTLAMSSQCGIQNTDARLFAGTKRLFCFDRQLRQHEAVTDSCGLVWAGFNGELLSITTVSDMHVVVWDALLGSKKNEYRYLNPAEMTACCFDDRRRKLIVGDINGNIRVYNPRNGALMKSCSHDVRSRVIGLLYTSVTRSFIAGFSNGLIRVYSEDQLETCSVIRTFDELHCHRELQALAYAPSSKVVVSCGADGQEGIKFWDYTKGKCECAVHVCPPGASTLALCFMEPYALLATADTEGNITILASRGCKWFGMCVITFANCVPHGALVEQLSEKDFVTKSKKRKSDFGTFDATTRRIIAPDVLDQVPSNDDDFKHNHSHRRENSFRTRSQITYLQPSESDLRTSTAQCLSWDARSGALYTGDAAGELRRWNCCDFVVEFVQRGGRGACEDGKAAPQDQNGKGIGDARYVQEIDFSDKIKFQWSVKAHDNGCDFVEACELPAGIMTYSTDRCVKMWDSNGLLVGVLLQRINVGDKSNCWDMNVDVTEEEELHRGHIEEILEYVAEPEVPCSKSDFMYSSFQKKSHNELLEDIACTGFSRSYLRRRIELSSKNVGLDFSDSVSEKYLTSRPSDEASFSTKQVIAAKTLQALDVRRPVLLSATANEKPVKASKNQDTNNHTVAPPRSIDRADGDQVISAKLSDTKTQSMKSYARLVTALDMTAQSRPTSAESTYKPTGKYAAKLLSHLALAGTIDIPSWLMTDSNDYNDGKDDQETNKVPVNIMVQSNLDSTLSSIPSTPTSLSDTGASSDVNFFAMPCTPPDTNNGNEDDDSVLTDPTIL